LKSQGLGPLFLSALLVLTPISLRGQTQETSPAPQAISADESEFKRLAAEILRRRGDGGAATNGTASLEESALKIVDGLTLTTLNAAGEPQLDALNQRLGALVAQPRPVGQGFVVEPLGGSPVVFALQANFGSSGPSAVRLYSRTADQYRLAARIDPITQADYFDDFLVLLPVAVSGGSADAVFVTVTGRSDEYATGVFAAWRFGGGRLQELWSTDLVPRTSYEPQADGVVITYCAEPEEDQPGVCRRMTRERYVWDGSAWKRVDQTELGPPKP
jgi:hypothetical protein